MRLLISLLLIVKSVYALPNVSWQDQRPPIYAYDPGPDLSVDCEEIKPLPCPQDLVDLHATIPSFPGISENIMYYDRGKPEQKFRPAYGPIPWRMILQSNSVKILFIGQDGTHVAEAAGRPATAGFGGRAQDLANFFGVEYSAAFINTYAFTINGQYGSRGAPYVKNGKLRNVVSSDQSNPVTIVPNDVWMMSQHPLSPITQWRNDLIEWIIRNNPDSLKLIVLFGQSAKDSMASFVEANGGNVGSHNQGDMDKIQIPEFVNEYAGGNNVFPVPFNKEGRDLYSTLSGERLSYSGSGKSTAIRLATRKSKEVVENMVFSEAGPYKNGLLHHAQFGGYDLNKMVITEGTLPTRSLKGLILKNEKGKNYEIKQDILVTGLPHPTYLSKLMNKHSMIKWMELGYKDEFFQKTLTKKGISEDEYMTAMDYAFDRLVDSIEKYDEPIVPKIHKKIIEDLLAMKDELSTSDLRAAWENYLLNDEKASLEFFGQAYNIAERKIGNNRIYGFFRDLLKSHPNKSFAGKITGEGYDHGRKVVGEIVEKDVAKLRTFADKTGWNIPADASDSEKKNENTFAKGEHYDYGRSDIHSVFYDFGTPNNRMVSKSTARRGKHKVGRESKGSQIIIFGTRDVPSYDKGLMDELLKAEANQELPEDEFFISKLRTPELRYEYDPGPPADYAEAMKVFDSKHDVYSKKSGSGIDAYNIKSHPSIGDFGHYRGTFDNPLAIIFADPDGYDDLITARALTGTRGQYLQGLMTDLGINDQYLVIKTVPFGMDGATDAEWAATMEATKEYREGLLEKLLKDKTPEIIIADGPQAKAWLSEVLKGEAKSKFVYIDRLGTANNTGIEQAARYIRSKSSRFANKEISLGMVNIPRSHLSYYARAWEGTSGDRVMNSTGSRYKGIAFQEVVPDWVMEQPFTLQKSVEEKVAGMIEYLASQGFRLPSQTVEDFVKEQSSALKNAN